MKKIYLIIYKNCCMFGNFDENKDFYYYELIRYYKDEHGNESTNNCFFDLLLKYQRQFKIEMIDKRDIEY